MTEIRLKSEKLDMTAGTVERVWEIDLTKLDGYPFLPCPICNGVEGCDHTVPERARATGLNLFMQPYR